jgi:hypothetical protein
LRPNTWWNQGKAWLDYATRCQNLLQQGQFVADPLYFTGEEAPNAAPSVETLEPSLPQGHDYDTINEETILKRLKIGNGRIVLPDGTSYRVLVLQNHRALTLELVRKISATW